jgi:DNA-binding FadR family transcriptional regulator
VAITSQQAAEKLPARVAGPGRRASDPPGSVEPKSKRAARIADRIVADVIELGWPVGRILGSEAELIGRYQVSRAVFREAVRLVENQQVASTRRGPGGGLVITEPTVDAVTDAVVLYLYRVEAPLDEVFEARVVLEEIATEVAAARIDSRDRSQLRSLTEAASSQPRGRSDPRSLHSLVASMTRNPAIELFVDVVHRVAMLYFSRWPDFSPDIWAETTNAHARIAAALSSGDGALARRRMRRHLEAEAGYLRQRRSTRQVLPDSVVVLGQPGNGKRAEAVARRITQAVVGDGMRPGQLVGTEPELIGRQGVSRAVLREAVRLLEHHQIARMRRGPGGGLFVFEPSTAAVTDVAAIYLARHGMRLVDVAELRTGVEVGLADLAAARISPAGAALVSDAVAREAAAPDDEAADVMRQLHAAIAAVGGNRVLELVALVLIRLSRIHQIERLAVGAREHIQAEVLTAHQGIAAAVAAGNRALARDRMREHLDTLGALTRR